MFFDRSLYVLPSPIQPPIINTNKLTSFLPPASQWETYAISNPSNPPFPLTRPTDPLPHRPNPNNRLRKDLRLLLPSPKAQRHGCLRIRHSLNSLPLASNRLHNRALRPLHPLWRFPDHNWPVRWEYPRRGAVHSKGFGDIGGWEKECGVAGIGFTLPPPPLSFFL